MQAMQPRIHLANRGSRHRPLRCCASIRARWCLDARYGRKQEATSLLQEWVQTVGRSAGLTAQNTRLSSGSLGVPESRLEMEVEFDSMADWDGFLSKIPYQAHKAWTQRIASMVVDGSPVWQVHRTIPLTVTTPEEAAASSRATQPSASSSSTRASSKELVLTDQISTADIAAWEQLKRDSSSEGGSGSSSAGQSSWDVAEPSTPPPSSSKPEPGVQLDWKGEPIKFNPGDKLPFKFL